MTLRQEIAEFLQGRKGETFTNAQIAGKIFANKPSVRRVTLALSTEGVISEVGNSGAMVYTVKAPTASPATY